MKDERISLDKAIKMFEDHPLRPEVFKYLGILEGIFGPRDTRFEFKNIMRSLPDYAHVSFRGGFCPSGCGTDIRITHQAYDQKLTDQTLWQVAHECVHLLDPCLAGEGTDLEEGIAAWFQHEPQFHNAEVQSYINGFDHYPDYPDYACAKQLVKSCIPDGLFEAVKELRAQGIRLCDIAAEELHSHMPNTDFYILNRLCRKFPIQE